MSQWARTIFVFGVVIHVAIAAIIFAEAAKPLIDLAKNELSGPFTQIATQINHVIPILLAVVLLSAVIYLLVGPVQRERTRRVRRRP